MRRQSPQAWAHPAIGMQRLLPPTVAFVVSAGAWNVLATLTSSDAVRVERCHAALRKWLRHTARVLVRAHVAFFWARDRQARGAYHFHVLLALTEEAYASDLIALDTLWRRSDPAAGFARVERVADSTAIARYALSNHDDWDLT